MLDALEPMEVDFHSSIEIVNIFNIMQSQI